MVAPLTTFPVLRSHCDYWKSPWWQSNSCN